MDINRETLDRLLADYPSDRLGGVNGENGLLQQIVKVILEQALQDEIVCLGGLSKEVDDNPEKRKREGKTARIVTGNFGRRQGAVSRSADLTSAPSVLLGRQARPGGVHDKIVALHVRGMTAAEIQHHLKEFDNVQVTSDTVAAFTGAIVGEVNRWRVRPLESLYPLVYLDSVRAKVRDDGQVAIREIYLAVGVTLDGAKDVLGMWIAESDGVRFWLMVLADLKKRGVQDIFIVCADGMKEFSEVGKTVFPDVQVLPYVACMVRNCLKYVSWKERKEVVAELKAVYQAVTWEQAELQLRAFTEKWQASHPAVSQAWSGNRERIVPLFEYPQDVRKVICATSTIEALYTSLDKVARDRRAAASDELLLQLLYLTLSQITKRWSMPVRDWKTVLNRFSVRFAGRMPAH